MIIKKAKHFLLFFGLFTLVHGIRLYLEARSNSLSPSYYLSLFLVTLGGITSGTGLITEEQESNSLEKLLFSYLFALLLFAFVVFISIEVKSLG